MTLALFGSENGGGPFKIADTSIGKRESKYLYSPDYGLPVVREELSYAELLKAIRQEEVTELKWLDSPSAFPWEPEGPCLAIFKDGRVKQSYVPFNDTRVWYAMESHGVQGATRSGSEEIRALGWPRS